MPDTLLPARASIKVDGSELTGDESYNIVSVRVESSTGAADWAEIVIDDPNFGESWLTKFKIEAKIEVAFTSHDDASESTVFVGSVAGVALAAGSDMAVRLVITAYDKRVSLGGDVKIRSFLNVTYASMISTIAEDVGLTADVTGLTSPTFPYLAQATTNQQWLEHICRLNGCEWLIIGNKLTVRPKADNSSITLNYGEDLITFRARYAAVDDVTSVEVRGWDPSTKQAIVGNHEGSETRLRSSAPAGSTARDSAPPDKVARSSKVVVGSDAEADQMAESIARRMVGATLTAEGETLGTPQLVAGTVCTIEGVGSQWSGDYYITSVEHSFGSRESYTTTFRASTIEPSSLIEIFGALSSSDVGFGTGVTVALVTQNDPEDDPDGLGRIKVKFPYLAEDLESDWIRYTTIGGGADRGIQFTPEIDDEVLVAFEHGDIRRPYVIGSLWNGTDKPALPTAVENGKVTERVIVSRLGHKIRLRDGDDDENSFVSIELEDGVTKAHFGASKIEVIANDKTIELKTSDGSILMAENGDITLKGVNITLEASGDVDIKGQNITVAAQQAAKISGTSPSEFKGSGPLTIESSAILNLKGSMVKVN